MYCFFNKFFFKVEIFGNLPIFCHAHLVAIQDSVDREILFDRCGKCPMLCLFFDFKWTISAVKSTANVMPCFMRQHSAFLCGGLAFAAINDKEIVKERDCEIVFEFNILAITVCQADWDRRYSSDNRAWANAMSIPANPDAWGTDRNCYLAVNSHPGLVDLFLSQTRKAYAQEQQKTSVRDMLKKLPETTSPKISAKSKSPER